MVAPLPAQPHLSASAPNKPVRKRPKSVRIVAREWAREQDIPKNFPNGTRVRYPARVKATLVQLSDWCNEHDGFEPQPILENFTKKNGEPATGILKALGFDVNVYRQCISALGRLGFISTKFGGNQKRRAQYILHVNRIRSEYQEPLPEPEIRTESVDDEVGHVPNGHGRTVGHVPNGHGRTDLTLYRPTHEDDLPIEGSAHLPMLELDGGAQTSSFCSNFLIPSLEAAGLQGFTPASLSFIDLAASDFAQAHGRPPDKPIADHMAARLVGFIRDTSVDVAAEPHRVFGFIRKQLVPIVPVDETVSLRFDLQQLKPTLTAGTPPRDIGAELDELGMELVDGKLRKKA